MGKERLTQLLVLIITLNFTKKTVFLGTTSGGQSTSQYMSGNQCQYTMSLRTKYIYQVSLSEGGWRVRGPSPLFLLLLCLTFLIHVLWWHEQSIKRLGSIPSRSQAFSFHSCTCTCTCTYMYVQYVLQTKPLVPLCTVYDTVFAG